MVETTNIVNTLETEEIDTLLNLYYNDEQIIDESAALNQLVDKNLISTKILDNTNIISLTDEGMNICGAIMNDRILKNQDIFYEKISVFPDRTVACLVNRVMWRDMTSKETGAMDPVLTSYELDESLWYERVLLKSAKFGEILESFYGILEDVGFIKNINGQRWCPPEAESFLKDEYKNMMDISWVEEDMLKYFFFFYIYAQDQKTLINFEGNEDYRTVFFGETGSPPEYWYSSNRNNPVELIANLGISEQRIIGFLEELRDKLIVNERYYPLTSFTFFTEDDRIFVIKDIKKYMEYLGKKFLDPVVKDLISI